MGKEGLEPSRLATHGPKPCLSTNFSTSPNDLVDYRRGICVSQWRDIITFFTNKGTLILGRIINPDGIGKERKRLVRAIVISLRELNQQAEQNDLTRDLLAFIALCLTSIGEGIDVTVVPWEKRGYWVKADRFRLEWDWTEMLGKKLRSALEADDWSSIPEFIVKIGAKFSNVEVSIRHRLGKPWIGAWEKMTQI